MVDSDSDSDSDSVLMVSISISMVCGHFRFLDILHEAPLFGDRKSRSIFGSVFYCFCLASTNFGFNCIVCVMFLLT